MPGPNCSATITTNALVRAAELTARDQSSPLPQNIKLPKIDLALLQVMVRTKNFPESVCRSITLVAVDAPAK